MEYNLNKLFKNKLIQIKINKNIMGCKINTSKYINQENLTISIVLDNYCIKPENYIEGNIYISPKITSAIKIQNPKLIFTLTQFEFYEHQNKENYEGKINENAQQHKEIIFTKEASFSLKESNTISKCIKIPIKISLPKNEKLLPTFEYHSSEFIIGIRHIFTVEFPELKSINSIGIIICKPANLNNNKINENDETLKMSGGEIIIFKDEQIYSMGMFNKGKISYLIRTAKKEYQFGDDILIKIMLDSTGLQDYNIQNIKIKLQKKITIFGFPLNNKIERNVIQEKTFEKNELEEKQSSKYELEFNLSKVEEIKINQKEFQQYLYFNEKILNNFENISQLTPSMKGHLFSCEYKIKIRTILNSNLITTKKVDIPIELTIPENYFENFISELEKKEDVKENENNELKSYIIFDNKEGVIEETKVSINIGDNKEENKQNDKNSEILDKEKNK